MNYKVYQGDELKQTVTSKTAVMNGLQPNKTYDFSVQPDNTQTVGGRTRYTHIAYANSADGTDGFYVGGGTNLVSGTNQEYAMGFGIPNTTWDDGYAYLKLPTTIMNGGEILPQGSHDFWYTLTQGVTYTQTIWFETDATVKDLNAVQFTWYTNAGHDWQPARVQKLGQNSYKVVSTYTWPGKSDNSVRLFDIGQLGSAFDLSTGTYLKFGKLKLEEGSVSTGWSPAPSESHPIYIGTYTDLTQTDSTNPLDYTWNPIRDGDATRDGTKETVSVTTRGIQFNIPKTLTVGSTITLRYEEYPLGIVPIGNEPSGYFGGGNKQNLSATVISTANGSSIIEVGGNVIEVGGRNLLQGTSGELSGKSYVFAGYQISGGLLPGTTYTLSGWARVDQTAINHKQFVFASDYTNDWSWSNQLTISGSLTSQYNKLTFTTPSGKEFNPSVAVYLSHPDGGTNESNNDSISGMGYISKFKLEQGTIATPYASFVDGDTFTAQPDGTCALFSEHKAIYY